MDEVSVTPVLVSRSRMNADCVAMCSREEERSVFILGMYQMIDKDAQLRTGGMEVFAVENDSQPTLQSLSFSETPAVLDVSVSCDRQHIAVGFDIGRVAVYSFDGVALALCGKWDVNRDKVLCLFVRWSADDSSILVGMSDGTVALLDARTLETRSSWTAHDFSVWSGMHAGPDTVWTGGDDLRARLWDVRADPVPRMSLSHGAGVTAIVAHPTHGEDALFTGSYDELVRRWDVRAARRPVCEVGVGGGAWHFEWHPARPERLAVAAMHAGAAVVEVGSDTLQVSRRCTEHESMAYGIGWGTDDQVISCSFYDNRICVWDSCLRSEEKQA